MKTFSRVCLVAIAVVVGRPGAAAADTARFRYVHSIYADANGVGLNRPEAVACAAGGQIVIGDTGNNRLLRFTYVDKALSGGTEIKIPQLSTPSRLQVNSKGEIYALDSTQRRIAHFAPNGEFKEALGFDAVPPPTTIVPKGFALDSADNIYVLDVFSARVLVLDPLGQFQKALPFPEGAGFISELTVDFAGNVFLLDSIGRRLFSAAKDGSAFAPLGGELAQFVATIPTYVITSKGTIFVVEGNGSRVVAFGRDGSFLTRQLGFGWNEGLLNHPSQMCINEKDEAFVADTENSRIEVFQLVR